MPPQQQQLLLAQAQAQAQAHGMQQIVNSGTYLQKNKESKKIKKFTLTFLIYPIQVAAGVRITTTNIYLFIDM